MEDEVLVRMAVSDELTAEGYRVLEAGNADEAIRMLETEPDVWAIFTDVDMPGSMDGLKLAFAVRDRWPPVHIFVTSGHRIVEVDMMPERSSFFAKPYDIAKLISAFRSL
ncbi:MAG: response regulator [Rhizobiaceae bacterium]